MTHKKQAADDSPLMAHYAGLVQEGRIKDDPAQHQVLVLLEDLRRRLAPSQPQSGRLGKLFGRRETTSAKGLYIWGNVGRGKSMLMDLFFTHAPVKKKRRVHFHAFMQEVHRRIHQLRQSNQREKDVGDPVMILAQQLVEETSLLCFDELQATDVADATLLYRLFEQLFSAGVIVVSTSNHPPASLYTGGVQRERFAKFIALIEERMKVVSLSSPLDYRHLQIKNLQQTYFHPLGPAADAFVADALNHLCANPKPKRKTLIVKGRPLIFSLYDDSIGSFTFHELCEKALGPADYLALAKLLDTLILTGIPKLPPEKRNEAKRFVTLIDALYEHKVRLLCTAEGPPEQIYSEGDGTFEFNRTVSRLVEMQSAQWIEDE